MCGRRTGPSAPILSYGDRRAARPQRPDHGMSRSRPAPKQDRARKNSFGSWRDVVMLMDVVCAVRGGSVCTARLTTTILLCALITQIILQVYTLAALSTRRELVKLSHSTTTSSPYAFRTTRPRPAGVGEPPDAIGANEPRGDTSRLDASRIAPAALAALGSSPAARAW